ncbi:MAG: hypothetical protein ACJAVR_003870 [Paracoccaceae bacterium]|jgi:hypothetical protein
MFDAVVARKARLSCIIDGVGKQPREDLITSAIFGTLRFLTPEARALALEALCGHQFEGDVLIYLWPFFQGDGGGSEPDVVLEETVEGRRAYWIVEVKWGAGLGEDQAAREIRSVESGHCRRGELPKGPRHVMGYTLLGAEKKHEKAIEDLRGGYPQTPAITVWTWKDMCDRLRSLVDTTSDTGLVAWARLAANFLAGEPQGAVLGPWPAMTMPEACTFSFDEEFELPSIPAVPETHYDYRESE